MLAHTGLVQTICNKNKMMNTLAILFSSNAGVKYSYIQRRFIELILKYSGVCLLRYTQTVTLNGPHKLQS